MQKNLVKISILLLIIVISSSSCKKIFQIEGNYHLDQQERALPHFNSVSVKGNIDVFIQQTEQNNITIEAESNLLPYIITDVRNYSLTIREARHRNIKNHLPIKIYINTNLYAIESITLSGSGSIKSDSINIDNLNLDINGSGNIYMDLFSKNLSADISGSGDMFLSGVTNYSSLRISGSGDINAYDLFQKTCDARISGSGNMYIYVSDYLNVKISGSGEVFYSGNPVVNTDISGSGQVIHNL
jgi:hypothetical protein